MCDKISIRGLDKSKVLAALVNEALPGFGTKERAEGDVSMTPAQAHSILQEGPYFTSIGDRLVNVNLSQDSFDPWLYDLVNGEGSAAYAVAGLR